MTLRNISLSLQYHLVTEPDRHCNKNVHFVITLLFTSYFRLLEFDGDGTQQPHHNGVDDKSSCCWWFLLFLFFHHVVPVSGELHRATAPGRNCGQPHTRCSAASLCFRSKRLRYSPVAKQATTGPFPLSQACL
jgi:hypothetical protein